jgi:DNA polymerase I-like protein with 3'-5' exonuclease and polymerase domains
MCAMLRIEENARLKALGFRQVLQVHDEIILEVRICRSVVL